MKLIVQMNFEGTCMEAECVSTARWFLKMERQDETVILQRKKIQEALYFLCLNFDMDKVQFTFLRLPPLISIHQLKKKKKTLLRSNNYILLKLKIHVVWLWAF